MSCLFDSLSHYFNINSSQIREIICNYLEKNGSIIEGLDTDFILSLDGTKQDYVNNMRNCNTWGGGIEIKAASNIFKVRILVHVINNGKIIEFLPIDNCIYKTIELSWTGNHFEPVR